MWGEQLNIYISHPYGGKEENAREVEEIIKDLAERYPHNTYISPIHTFSFMYHSVPYQQGLDMCIELLKLCDMMYVYGDHKNSKGCTAEIKYCKENDKLYVIFDTQHKNS